MAFLEVERLRLGMGEKGARFAAMTYCPLDNSSIIT